MIRFSRHMDWRPDWTIIRSLFRFGLPTGVQGIAMNMAGVMLLRFIGSLEQSAAAQAAYAIGYTELFSLITWTSVGLMGAAATIAGQNLGAGHPERAIQGVHHAARIGFTVAAVVGLMFVAVPACPARDLRRDRTGRGDRSARAPAQYLAVSGFFITVALILHGWPAGHRRHAQPAVHHAGFADCRADRPVHAHPGDAAACSRPTSGWRSCSATSRAAC